MTTTSSKLSPYERFMVKSNLETIRRGTPVEELVATLRANGYARVADAVREAHARMRDGDAPAE